MTNPDMPGLEEAIEAATKAAIELGFDRLDIEPNSKIYRQIKVAVTPYIAGAYPIIERAVRKQIADHLYTAYLDELQRWTRRPALPDFAEGILWASAEIRGTATEGEQGD